MTENNKNKLSWKCFSDRIAQTANTAESSCGQQILKDSLILIYSCFNQLNNIFDAKFKCICWLGSVKLIFFFFCRHNCIISVRLLKVFCLLLLTEMVTLAAKSFGSAIFFYSKSETSFFFSHQNIKSSLCCASSEWTSHLFAPLLSPVPGTERHAAGFKVRQTSSCAATKQDPVSFGVREFYYLQFDSGHYVKNPHWFLHSTLLLPVKTTVRMNSDVSSCADFTGLSVSERHSLKYSDTYQFVYSDVLRGCLCINGLSVCLSCM